MRDALRPLVVLCVVSLVAARAPGSAAAATPSISSSIDGIAGGHSLIPLMKLRLSEPGTLIDINRIAGLDTIAESDGALRIGALVREAALESSALVQKKYPILADTARVIADPLARNDWRPPAEPAVVEAQARRRLEKWSQTPLLSYASPRGMDRSQRAAPGGVMVPLYEPHV